MTSNAPDTMYAGLLQNYQNTLSRFIGPTKVLVSGETLQLKDYSKNDWTMWTAAMAGDKETFLKFVEPVYKYINETESRVPISDWSDTKTAKMVGFKARSVIGGYWMRVLSEKLKK